MVRIDWKEKKNLTMLTDFYELTMSNGYFQHGMKDTIAYFDMFFRKVPDGGGFAIMAGVEQLIEYLKNLRFTAEDLDYLHSKKIFSPDFWSTWKTFSFPAMCGQYPKGRQFSLMNLL